MIRFIIASFFLAIVLAGVPGPVQDSAAGEEVLSRSKRVVGGTLAKINDQPWMASIQVHKSHYCGGTIISESVVLTTARCLEVTERRSTKADTLNKLSVRVGSPNSENGGYVHRAVDLIAHDGFRDFSYRGKVRTYNDVALLKVEPPFKLGGDVQKISLVGKDYIATQGQVGSISGWGRTAQGSSKSPELRSASVRIANATECAEIYADSLLDWSGLLCTTASGQTNASTTKVAHL